MAMLVPRSFAFRSPPQLPNNGDLEKAQPQPRRKEKLDQPNGWRGFGWRPESFHKFQPEPPKGKDKKDENATPTKISPAADLAQQQHRDSTVTEDESLSGRSTPVAVPLRSRQKQGLASASPTEAQADRRRSTPRSLRQQDSRPLPPSVAALLASTSIPKKKAFRQPTSVPRRMSTQQLMDEWRNSDTNEGSSISSSPTMDFLLSPPREDDFLTRSDSMESLGAMSRSASSDSIPGLEIDENSILSWDSPSTPNASSQRKSRGKTHSRATELDPVHDHPLSPPSSDEIEPDESYFESKTARASPSRKPSAVSSTDFRPTLNSTRKPSAFKSNLTASLNSLRSSIRSSLSNFSAPSLYTLPDDHLSRGLFSDAPFPYRNEMRPRPLDGPPTAELRRYLNPSSYHVRSPAQDFHLHCHGRVIEHIDLEAAAARSASPRALDEPTPTTPIRGAVIALQPFSRVPIASQRPGHSSRDTLTEAGRGLGLLEEHQEPRYRREPRENGEFLRVCVLEMNMRRAGKFSDGVGRATVWLPPREERFLSAGDELRAAGEGQHVPKRWVGISP